MKGGGFFNKLKSRSENKYIVSRRVAGKVKKLRLVMPGHVIAGGSEDGDYFERNGLRMI